MNVTREVTKESDFTLRRRKRRKVTNVGGKDRFCPGTKVFLSRRNFVAVVALVLNKEIVMQLPVSNSLRPSPRASRLDLFRRTSLPLVGSALLVLALISGCKNLQTGQQPAAPSDQQLTSNIQTKLQGESALAGQNIQVSVSNGVATLNGAVSDEASRALAANDSGTVSGVKTVVNNLTVESAKEPPAAAPAAAPAPAERSKPAARHDRRPVMAEAAPQQQPAPRPMNNTPQPQQQAVAAAPAPPPPPRPVTQQYTLDSGTTIPVTLTETLDSKTTQQNDAFHGTLASDVVSNGVVVIPRGSPVTGRVVEVHEATHFKGASLLTVELTQVTARGQRISLVTDTYSKEGAARGKNTAMKSGGGAALGAIIGALAGGGKGAAIGAVTGAGAGAGVNAVTRGEQVQIPSETRLQFRLQSPVTVSVTTTSGARPPYEPNAEPSLQQR